MAFPHLQVRRAVRDALADVSPGELVLVACSGGSDSLSLAAATAFEARAAGWRAGGVSVDHGLQRGSAQRARDVAATLAVLGLNPVEAIHVSADGGPSGPEGNARAARYRALDGAARRHNAASVLLGHTRDDQAETVLLGLARGSGARSLAGMPERSALYRRPLLRLSRDVVRQALPEGLLPWDDPHNADPAYARARVRHAVLPTLEAELGPGIADALARTADLLRADADALDEIVDTHWREWTAERGTEIGVLADLPRAIRWRLLRRAAIDAGCPPTDLTAAHVAAIDTLIMDWRGQKGIDLPGGIRAARVDKTLRFTHVP